MECAQLLLAAEASVEIKDADGWGPQPMSRFSSPFFTGNHKNRFNKYNMVQFNECSMSQ